MEDARRATVAQDAYDDAIEALNREKVLEETYQAAPTDSASSGFGDAAVDFYAALGGMEAVGSSDEVLAAVSSIRKNHAFATSVRMMFTGTKAEASRLSRTEINPRYASLIRDLNAQRRTLHRRAIAAAERLQKTQLLIAAATPAIWLAGLLLLCVFIYVLETYRRYIDDAHEDEVSRLAEAALTDNLTKLGNHRAFQEDLHRGVALAKRQRDPLSLALIDLDEFKVLNDLNGHQAGDEALSVVAETLQKLRASDRAFRIGGDEFAVILPHTSTGEATVVMQRVRAAVQARLQGTTVSIGIASTASANGDAEILRGQADAALYAAKRAGRNAVDAFDDAKDGMWLLSPAKVRSLRQLIHEGDIKIAFQPIWDVEHCRVLAYEALARPDRRYGFAGPQDAFDLAERMGRSPDLDAACRKATLARAYEIPEDVLLFINVCPQTLEREGIDGYRLLDAVRRAGLTPDRVVVEITEKSVGKLDVLIAAAKELRQFGFRLALDDTGAGNAGLEILTKLPLDFVKIDRGIIVKALDDIGARGVLAGIIAIARAVGAYVIAEGIETEEMLALVCSNGLGRAARGGAVNGVQGYFLQRPSESVPSPSELGGTQSLLRHAQEDLAPARAS